MAGFWDVLTSSGLASFAAAIVVFVLVSLAFEAFLDWRAKQPLFRRQTHAERLLNWGWLAIIFGVVYLPEEFEKWGIPGWLAFALPVPLIYFGIRATARKKFDSARQSNARPNPNANPHEDAMTAENFSAEELKVNAKLFGVIIAFGVLSIGLVTYLLPMALKVGEPPNLWGLSGLLVMTTGLLGILTYCAVGRWPGRLHLRSSVVIQRSLADVWSASQFRDTRQWWNPIVQRVQALPGPGERYMMHYYCDDTCGRCGLPRDPDVPSRAIMVEVLHLEPQKQMHVRSRTVGSPSVEGMMDHEETLRTFEALGPETTRVSSHNICVRPKVWLALVLKLGDPIGEELRNLKAQLEGKPLGTLFAAAAARIEAHRNAERFCGCEAGAPIAHKFIT